MATTKRKILIIEDDETFSAALVRGLTKENYQVSAFSDSDQALLALKQQRFHLALVDCILPKASGVELAKMMTQIRPEMSIVMMSGVCSGEEFLEEVRDKVPDCVFLNKPFDIETLNNCIRLQVFEDDTTLEDSLFNKVLSAADDIQVLTKGIYAPGMDLPRVFSRLAYARATGRLELSSNETGHSYVCFKEGSIVGFFSPKVEVYRPQILAALKSQSLGDDDLRDVESLELGLQLGDLMIEGSYNLRFDPGEDKVAAGGAEISSRFNWFLGQWIVSKVRADWLKAFFEPWLDCGIHERGDLSRARDMFGEFDGLNSTLAVIKGGVTPRQLLLDDIGKEAVIHAALYALVCADLVYFDRSRTLQELTSELLILEEIASGLAGKEDLAVLGLKAGATKNRVTEAYQRWFGTFDPEKSPEKTPDSIRLLNEVICRRLTRAYQNLIDAAPADAVEAQDENRLVAEILFEEGRKLLRLYDGMGALRKFEEAIMRGATHAPAEFTLCCIWAQLLALSKTKTMNDSLETIRIQLESLPHEMRHTPTYYFVRGLLEKRIENVAAAKKYFKEALIMEKDFVEAKRELHILSLNKEPRWRFLRQDF